MSIISALKTYIGNYSSLKANAPLWVDYLGATPTGYSIVPLAGARQVESYINGGGAYEYPFAFQSMESTADELERIDTQGFYEAFASWMDSQTLTGNLPTLGTGQAATAIEATGSAYLFEQGSSETGVYQIQCKLSYEQQP